MTPRRVVRGALALLAVSIAGGIGFVSIERARDELSVLEGCRALEAGDLTTTLARTRGRVGADPTGRVAVECRCMALLARGEERACATALEAVLADPASGDWAPRADLSVHLIQMWRDAGRVADAAALARRAAVRHPLEPGIFHLELATRAAVEDEQRLLEELADRIPERGEAAARMRVSLAQRHLRRGSPQRALQALGSAPAEAGAAQGLWYDTQGISHAMADDVPAARAVYARWEEAGGDPEEIRARYALALSIAGLEDPDVTVLERLRRAVESPANLDPVLRETLAIRLVLTLVNAGRLDDAIRVHDRHSGDLPLEGLRREELERAARHRRLASTSPEARRGELRFELDAPLPGGALWLSPEPDLAPDSDYERVALPPAGAIQASRAAGLSPQRWVLRDALGAVRASGTVAPDPGETREVLVRVGPARTPAGYAPARDEADGRRRLALILLDCGDWHLVQYLRNRGELPVLDTLIREGHRAVLESNPPLTAAALESLVWPERRGGTSFVGVVHRMGVELSGLSAIGDNPFEALAWVLPQSDDLFAVFGEGDRRAANLLLAHGGIRAGRHGEVTGPQSRRERIALGAAERDLDAAERRRHSTIGGRLPERDAVHVRTIAAEMDHASRLVREGDIDFVAVRIEPLDILTHAHFADAVVDGQDDGEGLLYDVYRYLDERLAALSDALDRDDVLVVMSDHGIRTAMEHSSLAMFVAHGAGVPRGRSTGRPDLRGVARALADLQGVETRWPDSGVAPWVGLGGSRSALR